MDRTATAPAGLLSIADATIALGVSRKTLYQWMNRRILPFVWYGQRRYIERSTVDHFARPGVPGQRPGVQSDRTDNESYNPQITPRRVAAS